MIDTTLAILSNNLIELIRNGFIVMKKAENEEEEGKCFVSLMSRTISSEQRISE